MNSGPRAEPRLVLITHPPEGAESFARGLVEAGLAACVNLLETRSVYRWQGSVQLDDELLCVVKTVSGRLGELESHVGRAHPYDVPEFVVVVPEHVERGYLAWLQAETGS